MRIPRDRQDDFTPEAAARRRAFVLERTGVELDHVGRYSFDPALAAGNVEHFTGVAQVPIGLAGPLLVDGEHVQGEVYVPLATTEGTLVASYNRGMKLLRAAGGVRTTIVEDRMQRGPCFPFPSAREARDFVAWLDEHLEEVRDAAHATTSRGRLVEIERYHVGRFVYTRFDFTTGDAAGQNLTGRATWAACEWIKAHAPMVERYWLEGQTATDKKHSLINVLHTRGKRVIAEALIPDALLHEHFRVRARDLYRARQVSTIGGLLSGVANNGAHAANAIAAIFLATGQDVANVAESHAGIIYAELREDDLFYFSVTLPALIVATHGGGTGLPTQRECLAMMGCQGPGTVGRLAEIIAATVLCGDISLGSAIVAEEWVHAHEAHGRNR